MLDCHPWVSWISWRKPASLHACDAVVAHRTENSVRWEETVQHIVDWHSQRSERPAIGCKLEQSFVLRVPKIMNLQTNLNRVRALFIAHLRFLLRVHGLPSMPKSHAVCLRIFIYKGPKMKFGSVCRADRAQSNGPTLRSLANFHIELEQFCCSLTAA